MWSPKRSRQFFEDENNGVFVCKLECFGGEGNLQGAGKRKGRITGIMSLSGPEGLVSRVQM